MAGSGPAMTMERECMAALVNLRHQMSSFPGLTRESIPEPSRPPATAEPARRHQHITANQPRRNAVSANQVAIPTPSQKPADALLTHRPILTIKNRKSSPVSFPEGFKAYAFFGPPRDARKAIRDELFSFSSMDFLRFPLSSGRSIPTVPLPKLIGILRATQAGEE